jgi:hypothetical protein
MSKDTMEDEDEKTKPDPSSEDDDDEDEDDDFDDTSEDADQEDDKDEPAKKGIDGEQEVAVIDGDAVMAAIETTCQYSIEKAIGDNFAAAVQQAVDAVLANPDYQEKQRSMFAGQVKKALDLRIGAFTDAAEALTKAISSGETLQKSVAEVQDEVAMTTPATKTVSEEVLDKGIGTAATAIGGVNVSLLMKEGLELQIEKSIRIPLLDNYSMLGVAEKHAPANIAQLQKAISDARSLPQP